MKIIRYHQFNESDSDSDTMARHQLFGADAIMVFDFGNSLISNEDEIKILIKKYNDTYNSNKEWGGGPVNSEFINFFNKSNFTFLTKEKGGYGNSRGLAGYNSWKPCISLVITTPDYGRLITGYSLLDKKCKSMNWKNLKEFDKNYDQKVTDDIYRYVNKNIYQPQLTIDETINLLRLTIENKIDWNWENRIERFNKY